MPFLFIYLDRRQNEYEYKTGRQFDTVVQNGSANNIIIHREKEQKEPKIRNIKYTIQLVSNQF